jgi:hypothetical protein
VAHNLLANVNTEQGIVRGEWRTERILAVIVYVWNFPIVYIVRSGRVSTGSPNIDGRAGTVLVVALNIFIVGYHVPKTFVC